MEISEFYEKNFSKVTASVYRLIENWHDAEDITQDVFIRFMLMDDNEVEDESKYLFRMAKNKSIDYLRRKERYYQCIDVMEYPNEVDTVSSYDEQFQLSRVYSEIEKMKDSKYKTILKQHYIRGKSYEEISKELQVAKDVLRKNKLFGLNKLREKFGVVKI